MIYAVVALVVLFFAALIWAYTRGVQISKLQKDIENLKDYTWKQTETISAFMRVIRREDDLQEFLDKMDGVTDPVEFSELLNSYTQRPTAPNSSTVG
jgi:hypothetical protein